MFELNLLSARVYNNSWIKGEILKVSKYDVQLGKRENICAKCQIVRFYCLE